MKHLATWTLFVVLVVVSGAPGDDPQIVGIDYDTLKTIVFYAYATYCPDNQLLAWNCYWCFRGTSTKVTDIFNDTATNTFGYAGISANMIVVAFRGTRIDSLQNWITDLESGHHIPYPPVAGAEIGQGFYDAYLTIHTSVVAAVKRLVAKYPGYTVLVTGHSLGGALGMLCAAELLQQGIGNIIVRNFGCPRVGNTVFADYFHQHIPDIFRVTNQADIVPHLPPKLLNFYHTPTELWFQSNTTYFKVCDSSGEDPTCADSVTIPLGITDHLTYLGYDTRSGHPSGCMS